MGIGSRIDHNTVCSIKIGFLDPVDNGSLMIALERLDIIPGLLCLFVDQIQQIPIILRAVDFFLPDSQEIQVGSVDH